MSAQSQVYGHPIEYNGACWVYIDTHEPIHNNYREPLDSASLSHRDISDLPTNPED